MSKRSKLLLGLILGSSILMFGGCEQNFFASPLELLTPIVTPSVTPSSTAPNTATPAVAATLSPTPAATVTPTVTPMPDVTPTDTPTPTPTDTPTPTPTNTPIPTVQTVFEAPVTDVNDYAFIVNREHPLPDNYVPDDLTFLKHAQNTKSSEDKYKLRKVAAEAFDAMCDEAYAKKKLSIVGVSGYRSYDRQYQLYAGYLIRDGVSETNYYSAQPGTSEHQTGLALDISCQSCAFDLVNSFAKSAEGKWVAENAWRYGFIIRYSEDDVNITGYAYEPWHIRYVGIPLAYYLYQSGLTLEEYYGCPSTTTREYLDSTPLINTADSKFGKYLLNNLGNNGQLIYKDKERTTLLINEETFMPYIRSYVLTPNGAIAKDSTGLPIVAPVITDAAGNYIPDGNSVYVLTKKAAFVGEQIWLDSNGQPFYLDPILDKDGKLIRDSKGNVYFKDVLKSPDDSEIILGKDGLPIQLVPMRTSDFDIITNYKNKPLFYDPVSTNGLYAFDANGDLIWDSDRDKALEEESKITLTEVSPIH